MHVIIDEYGVKIEVEAASFRISNKETSRLLSPVKLESINLLKHCNITTAALVLAAENKIPVLIYNRYGKVKAWVWSPYYGNIATIRKKQVYFVDSKVALEWIRNILLAKAKKQLANLKWLGDRLVSPPSFPKVLTKVENSISELEKTALSKVNIRYKESKIALLYWESIGTIISKKTSFTKREKQSAKQPLNVAINYAYGILYGLVEASLLMVGLDSTMGILHIDRYKRPAMVFDHIEPFRPWIDRMVMDLFIRKELVAEYFEEDDLGHTIILKQGKKILVSRFFEFIDEKALLNGKRIKRHDHIHYQSALLVKEIKKVKI
jgi:CRISPR-associated protein Cas1